MENPYMLTLSHRESAKRAMCHPEDGRAILPGGSSGEAHDAR